MLFLKYDPEIQAVIKKMSSTKDTKMFKRYQTIYLRLKGHKIKEIPSIARLSERTVNYYLSAYKKDGLEGLIPIKATGQPKYLTDQQEAQLKEDIVNNVPNDFGFTAKYNWTIAIAKAHIKNKFDVEYSNSGTHKLLHRLGLSFTRPTYTLEKADSEKQEEFKRNFKDIKKN